jgi:hypothetical protein
VARRSILAFYSDRRKRGDDLGRVDEADLSVAQERPVRLDERAVPGFTVWREETVASGRGWIAKIVEGVDVAVRGAKT